jgi:hypothetical protein
MSRLWRTYSRVRILSPKFGSCLFIGGDYGVSSQVRRDVPVVIAAPSQRSVMFSPLGAPRAASAPAFAHDVAKGPHGGRVAEAGDYHVELVAKGDLIEIFLTDASERPVTPAGFKGMAIVVIAGKSARVVLEPTDARLSARAPGVLPTEPKVVVQITSPAGKTAQAKFH